VLGGIGGVFLVKLANVYGIKSTLRAESPCQGCVHLARLLAQACGKDKYGQHWSTCAVLWSDSSGVLCSYQHLPLLSLS